MKIVENFQTVLIFFLKWAKTNSHRSSTIITGSEIFFLFPSRLPSGVCIPFGLQWETVGSISLRTNGKLRDRRIRLPHGKTGWIRRWDVQIPSLGGGCSNSYFRRWRSSLLHPKVEKIGETSNIMWVGLELPEGMLRMPQTVLHLFLIRVEGNLRWKTGWPFSFTKSSEEIYFFGPKLITGIY